MSVNAPPNPNISTFNNEYWNTVDAPLTQAEADLRYLKFPVAQGTENLQAVNISGTTTISGAINSSGSNTFTGALNQFIGGARVSFAGSPFNIDMAASASTADIKSINYTSGEQAILNLYRLEFQNPPSNEIISMGNTTNTAGVAGFEAKNLTKTITMTTGGITMSIEDDLLLNVSGTATYIRQLLGSAITTLSASDSSYITPTTAWVQSAIAAIPAVPSLLGLNNTWTGTNSFSNTTAGSLTSSATQPVAGDSSTKIPTTAWVQSAITANIPTIYTYTQEFTGATSLTTITIPTGCVKFDIKVIGTGGLSYGTDVQPDGSTTCLSTGGGAGVAYKEGIIIIINNIKFVNTMTYENVNAGTSTGYCSVLLNTLEIARVYNGGNGTVSTGGLGCSTAPIVNTNWGAWRTFNGQIGMGNSITGFSAPPTYNQIGGGNYNGGVIGNPNATGYTSGALNQAGQGQQYGIIVGPNYGVTPFLASPINRGGVIMTWYIQS